VTDDRRGLSGAAGAGRAKRVGALPYRRNVGIMMLNREGLVLVGHRVDTKSDAWQMPQGGIDDGEEPEQALWRELKEEVGTDKATVLARARDWMPYDFPLDLQPTLWDGRFRGQTQMWFLLRFTGADADLALDTHKREFTHTKWVPAGELPGLAVGFKRESYRKVIAEFAAHLIVR
jgi:putative (di)nucleoside polyphosphate hydrolase